jgi:hypothetical protein
MVFFQFRRRIGLRAMRQFCRLMGHLAHSYRGIGWHVGEFPHRICDFRLFTTE